MLCIILLHSVIFTPTCKNTSKMTNILKLCFFIFLFSFLALMICFHHFSSLLIISAVHDAITGSSHNITESLPGFPGKLPFHLETGYVGVGENEGLQLFYYFIKSERNAEDDPLMLWLTGGPGCSAFSGLILENGPLMFNKSACNLNSTTPTFQLNPYSWTKVANIIFLDSPVGTGFSYAMDPQDYYSDDKIQSRHIYQFLKKWLINNDGFRDNPLYIAGDSYCGKIVPIVVQEIINGNKNGLQPPLNLQGYVLGNPYTWPEDKVQQTLHFAGRTSLLSDELYESLKKNCNGSYEEEDRKENPILCGRDIGESFENINPLFYPHTLKPKCISQQKWCQESAYSLLDYWANDKQVQASLHIRKGTKSNWIRCNKTLAYSQNVVSTVGYHQNFTQEFVRGLIYSGDQDMVVPYTGTLKWIRTLNVSISEHWRPWFVGNQVAGYATQFSNRNYHLTYTTVMGAGHTAAEYKGRECLAMIMRWFATQSL